MGRSGTGAVVLFLILSTPSPLLVAADDRRDGNWWQEQSRGMRISYMVGFFDGMELGHNFLFWKHSKGLWGNDRQCI
jgi:hypothetical protein